MPAGVRPLRSHPARLLPGRWWLVAAAVIGLAVDSSAEPKPTTALAPASCVLWTFDSMPLIDAHRATALGAPQVVRAGDFNCVHFDGVHDGLIVPANPLAGWGQFTIEVLIRPDADGAEAQRFLHIEDEEGSRVLLEIRLVGGGRWALDTFLRSDRGNLTLLDRTKTHPAGGWQWVALRYDGQRMSSLVGGRGESDGLVDFPPMKSGKASLGVRLNRVYWFKGSIREVRFTNAALPAEALQKF